MPLVPGEGLEPPTFGLQNRCTAAVLTRLGRRTYHEPAQPEITRWPANTPALRPAALSPWRANGRGGYNDQSQGSHAAPTPLVPLVGCRTP